MSVDNGWTPAIVPSGTEPFRSEDDARAASPTEQLAALRKLASDWRSGQLGILGLVSIVTLFKSETAMSQLGAPAAIVVGVTILVSLVTAAAAVFYLSSLAWGWPRLALQPSDRYASDASRVRTSIRRLKTSIGLTFASVILLSVALAATWYVPVRVSHQFQVVTSDGQICGKILGANPRTVMIAAGDTRVSVDTARLITVNPVSTCP
jgi:hypothetical protein